MIFVVPHIGQAAAHILYNNIIIVTIYPIQRS